MEMFQYDFIQRAFLAGGAISLMTPIIGLLLILRGQSLLSDTLSHVSLAGVALGIFLGLNPTWTTLIVVVVASLIIEYLRRVYTNFSDVSVAMMMATGMAAALVLIKLSPNQAGFKIDQYLFGSILLIQPDEVKLLYGLAFLIIALYIIFRRPLYVVSFDEDTAFTAGLPVRFISVAVSVLTGVVISVMMPIVGALLVSALIVIPSSTSIKLARSFTQAIFISWIINIIGIFSGLTASFYYDLPPGASITLIFVFIFILISAVQGLIRLYRWHAHR